jgi:hypothetical protein
MKNLFFLGCGTLCLALQPLNAQQQAQATTSTMFGNQAITFYAGNGSDFFQKQISNAIDTALKYDFPNKTQNRINAPTVIGYQYHVKERLSIGMVYSTSSVTTPDLIYPDFQNPGDITKYHYRVSMNSFLGSVDYHWYKHNFSKSSLTLHSGLALGVFNVNFNTIISEGNGRNLPQLNVSYGGNGWQINLIGIKQSFNYKVLRGLGYAANLGIGTNVVGMTYAITYTMN